MEIAPVYASLSYLGAIQITFQSFRNPYAHVIFIFFCIRHFQSSRVGKWSLVVEVAFRVCVVSWL